MDIPEPIVKILTQMPMVSILFYIWYSYRKDTIQEIRRLQDRLSEKDEQLREFTKGFERVTSAINLIGERLR